MARIKCVDSLNQGSRDYGFVGIRDEFWQELMGTPPTWFVTLAFSYVYSQLEDERQITEYVPFDETYEETVAILVTLMQSAQAYLIEHIEASDELRLDSLLDIQVLLQRIGNGGGLAAAKWCTKPGNWQYMLEYERHARL